MNRRRVSHLSADNIAGQLWEVEQSIAIEEERLEALRNLHKGLTSILEMGKRQHAENAVKEGC